VAQVDAGANDSDELRRCVRDLVALSTLPVIWINHDGRQIADSVAEALIAILGLEFVYIAAATGGRQIEVSRMGDRDAADRTEQLRAALAVWIGSAPPTDAVYIDNPVGAGTVRVFFLPIGFPEPAMIVAASRSPGFPSQTERLLLTVTANQMAVALRRRGAEEAVRQSEERFRQLADAMPQIVWMAQPDGHLDYYNQRWYDFTGFPQGETGFEGWRRLLHAADLRPCIETWTNSVRTGERFEIEYRFFDRISRQYRWHLGRALPVRNGDGNIIRWFGTCTDIDEQKRAAEKLQGLTQALEDRVAERTRQLEALVDLIQASLRGDIKIQTEIEPDLWPIEIDPNELELALLNIAVNARDAMPRGGTLSFSIRNKRVSHQQPGNDGIQQDSVMLTISDTGVGIPVEILSRVFEPFFTTKEIGKGTGLGLSQVYGFVKQSGGTVSLNSETGKGTAVSISFPRSLAPLRPAAPETAIDHALLKNGTVLIVDDNDEVAEVTGILLEHIGYRTHRACSATDALKMLLGRYDVDLVLTDIVMPGGISGLDLARELRRRFPKLPVLLTTGYSAAAQEATEDGFSILSKPYHRKALEEAVASIIAGKKIQKLV
jgi:PAS domain S-box-containing protein